MPQLTVTEKEHWKDRIARRIDKRIDAILAEDPHFKERADAEARTRAIVSLGLAELKSELDQVNLQQKTLEAREKELERAMLARVQGVPPESLSTSDTYYADSKIEQAIKRRQQVHHDELLSETERGQRILRLQEERENLLDTVWLATSSMQLRELWTKVAELLGDTPTQLERDALAIPAVTDA